MNKKAITDISASIRARLLNLARSTSRDFNELAVRYTVERFLARLAASEYRDKFILKGAMLYIPWKLDDKRTTMDLDLLGFGNSDLKSLQRVFRQICDTTVENDGIEFDNESIALSMIREEAFYDGVRVIARATLDTMHLRLQIDVGFGDQIVPAPQETEFPPLLAEHGPMIYSYSPETVIAEKFNAMTVLGMANSRLKDYFDIWMLSQSFTIEADILLEAIRLTFRKRRTEFPQQETVALSEVFSGNESKQKQWQGFIRKQRKQKTVPGLPEIIEALRIFLLPIISGINTGVLSVKTWQPSQGWTRIEVKTDR